MPIRRARSSAAMVTLSRTLTAPRHCDHEWSWRQVRSERAYKKEPSPPIAFRPPAFGSLYCAERMALFRPGRLQPRHSVCNTSGLVHLLIEGHGGLSAFGIEHFHRVVSRFRHEQTPAFHVDGEMIHRPWTLSKAMRAWSNNEDSCALARLETTSRLVMQDFICLSLARFFKVFLPSIPGRTKQGTLCSQRVPVDIGAGKHVARSQRTLDCVFEIAKRALDTRQSI